MRSWVAGLFVFVVACGDNEPASVRDAGPSVRNVRDGGPGAPLRVAWRRLEIAGPPPRGQPAIAVLGDRVVLFGGGGFRRGTFMRDTWIFEDDAWREVTTATTPPARTGGMMAANGGRLILWGGLGEDTSGLTVHTDTWAFDGASWSRVAATSAPQIRRGGAAIVGDTIVSYSGLDDDLARSTTTFVFEDDDWDARDVSPRPPGLRNSAMTTLDGFAYLHGGSSPAAIAAVWRWDGTQWDEAGAFATGRAYNALGALDGHLVTFGGVRSSTSTIAETDAWPGPIEVVGAEPPGDDDYAMVNRGDHVLMWGGNAGETWLLERAP
ncbi:MAG: hypothetical protein RMA76_16885 [Deltaproteobacteria bacterium]|jgi:hypothetical protein